MRKILLPLPGYGKNLNYLLYLLGYGENPIKSTTLIIWVKSKLPSAAAKLSRKPQAIFCHCYGMATEMIIKWDKGWVDGSEG
jgi:hypothetical protein